jgi:hypothetical protein
MTGKNWRISSVGNEMVSRILLKHCGTHCCCLKSRLMRSVGSSVGFTVATDRHFAGEEDAWSAVGSTMVVGDTGPARF